MASFLDMFVATDPAGVSAARYRLHFLGNQLLHADSWLFGMAADTVFALYQFLVIPACSLLGLVFSADTLLQPMSGVYEKFIGPLYAVFPPWAFAMVGLAIVVVSLLNSRVESTKKGMFTSEALTRLGAALAMVTLVAVLASNPFAMIERVLQLDNALASDFAAKVTHTHSGGAITTGQALVDQALRTPAIALNYGREFSAECKQHWSVAMASGQELSVDTGCFVNGQNRAGPDTVITAFVMLFLPALPMLAFSVIATWKYLLHISMSVLSAVSVTWVAAVKVHHKRGFERVAESFARVGAHMVMFVIISAVTVALPATVSGIALKVVSTVTSPEAQSYLAMVTLGVGFMVSTWVLVKVTSNTGALVRVLKADANHTLEATLGMDPKKRLTWSSYGFWKFNPFGNHVDSAVARAGSAKKKSPLADNPREIGADQGSAKGDGTVTSSPTSVDETDSVGHLMSPAVSVAAASGSLAAVAATAAAAAAASAESTLELEHTGDRTWNWQRNVAFIRADITRFGDVYGFYTDNSARVSTVNDYRAHTIDGEVLGVVYHDVPPSREVMLSDRGGSDAPGQSGSPDGNGSGGAPVLAPVERSTVSSDDQPGSPLRDYRSEPTERDVAAAAVAAFSDFGGELRRMFVESLPMRGFTGEQVVTTLSPFALMPAPSAVTVDVAEGEPESVHDDPGRTLELANDQQRWNKRWSIGGWRELLAIQAAAASQPVADGSASQRSGLVAATGTDARPDGFMAPLPDFLAAGELQAQMDEMRLVRAASGDQVVVLPPRGDGRLGLRLSSDPDERVVRACDDEFGDPL